MTSVAQRIVWGINFVIISASTVVPQTWQETTRVCSLVVCMCLLETPLCPALCIALCMEGLVLVLGVFCLARFSVYSVLFCGFIAWRATICQWVCLVCSCFLAKNSAKTTVDFLILSHLQKTRTCPSIELWDLAFSTHMTTSSFKHMQEKDLR